MTVELAMLFWAVMLGFIHLAVHMLSQRWQAGNAWTISARDKTHSHTGQAARMKRALRNYLETFPFFATLVLMGYMTNNSSWWSELGAQLYLWGRIAYLPAYALGTPGLRTLTWVIATTGIIMCMIPLANRTLFEMLIN